MRIAQISATFPPYMGGTGNVCYNYSLELAKLGHDVTVFTTKPKNNNWKCDNITLKRFKPLFKVGNAPFMPQLLNIKDYDIIHLHYPFFFGGEMIYLLKKLKGQNYIVSYHNNVIFSGFLGKLVNLHSTIIARRVLENAERILVPTMDFYNSSVKDFLGLKENSVVEVPNGVDITAFDHVKSNLRSRYEIKDDSFLILFVGALDKAHYYKGLEYLMRAFKKVLEEYKDIKLMIVGGGNLEGYYVNLAREYGINESTIFTGKISVFDELVKYYLDADIVVYPTTGSNIESFGMVLIEAMAAGKPVIASRIPGVRAVVDDNINGLLVEPKNVDDLTFKIKNLIEDKNLRDKLGRMGRKKAEEKYSWPKIVKKVEKVYENCIYNF